LQFDRAEPVAAKPSSCTCSRCKTKVTQTYYQFDGAVVCPACCQKVADGLYGGSDFLRFVKASVLGVIAGVIGAVILSWLQWGLIALLVGIIVGVAVRIGSGDRGGWAFQTLAVCITYLAVCCSFIPTLFSAAMANAQTPPAQSATTSDDGAIPLNVEDEEGDAKASATPAEVPAATPQADAPSVVGLILIVVFVIGFALVTPFLAGDILLLCVIGFALYEAWRINRRKDNRITGPFQIAGMVLVGPASLPVTTGTEAGATTTGTEAGATTTGTEAGSTTTGTEAGSTTTGTEAGPTPAGQP
jgi:TM2 domain-containing membrane protein YozV